ncbi:bifunctional diguanylate cyclase/phosphodiesterase [Clostridium sp. AM58-1XD]|uniref:bifunctional diguanylate cyclase/phosphodiesterase n=1 Tax=Clostridium sp. AM58-1XD TaxID=2292307 RepID=UPI000E54C9E8|nr:bifunctional diguanylate cyclase/phosphodiesterase [Clostridium sp. AM58-1XD]RGY97463.1 GGDEF domain-containing protein [Clostridium sp. AM58-1XD]
MAWFQKTKKDSAPDPSTTIHSYTEPQPRTALSFGRDGCYSHLQHLLDVQSAQSKGVVLKLYIENFKQLNGIFGYDYCETLLEQIINYLRDVSKSTVYRYIGVEFLIFLENATSGKAVSLAAKILDQFDHVWKVNGTDCLCSVQIGMCSYPGYTFSADEMMKFLDMALSKAAELGPNQYAVYDSNMQASFLRRQTIAHYLQTAIANHEIDVRYRPTYNIEQQKFTRAEYYMRIFVKGIGMVGAAEFLPIAEDSGQIRAVEYYALERVGACIKRLMDEEKEFDSIALPVSSVLFLQEDFLDKIHEIMDTYEIPRGKLAIELQEDAFTTAYLNINVLLQELSDMGIELILNNFGSGMSSVAGILELPINSLKLERMFIWQLETNPKASFVIHGLIEIARELELNIIAEGVETEKQIETLTSSGCLYQQGFYYSPTLDEDILIRIIGADRKEAFQIAAEEKEKAQR